MRPLQLVLPPLLIALVGCSAAAYREAADRQVYGLLETAAEGVTGQRKVFPIDRPVDTLRRAIEDQPEFAVVLDLPTALDVAAENSRAFQDRKERLYRVALSLTLQLRNFYWIPTGGTSPSVDGVGDDQTTLDIRSDLAASRNTESGGRIVASFINTFLKDLVSGGSFNGSSVLGITITQPLLAGFGKRIAREPLNQAERNVVYEMRSFERFRNTFAVTVTSQYYRVLQQLENLDSVRVNAEGTLTNRERVEALVDAGRLAGVDLDRAKQQEFDANDAENSQLALYQGSLDAFKITLGLPTDANIRLDERELKRLRDRPIELIEVDEAIAIELALTRRFDHRIVMDEVIDAARRVLVAEDALRSILDFSGAVAVPTDPGSPLDFDWDRVNWSLGFDLDLALERLPQRNAYRSSLIDLEANIRAREQSEDTVKQDVRQALRALRRTYTSYGINSDALVLSRGRLERADDFLQAGRGNTLALLDAQEDLLGSRLSVTRAIVDYAIARLELLRDLEGLVLEPKGLRYDPGLPLPADPLLGSAAGGQAD